LISDSLVQAFTEQFDCAPDRIVRAPGRVNLIGEHVDYAGLPVFPMALQYAVYVAVRPRDDRLVSVALPRVRDFKGVEERFGIRILTPGTFLLELEREGK